MPGFPWIPLCLWTSDPSSVPVHLWFPSPPSLLWAFHYGQGALTPPGLQRTLSSRPQPGAVPAPLLPLLSSAGSALICSSIIYSGEPTMAFWHAYLKCALSSPPATVDNKMCHTCKGSVVCVVHCTVLQLYSGVLSVLISWRTNRSSLLFICQLISQHSSMSPSVAW